MNKYLEFKQKMPWKNLRKYVSAHKITMNSQVHHHCQAFSLKQVTTIDNQ